MLDVVWQDEDTQLWHRRTFYGVTIQEQGLRDRDIESGFIDDQTWTAQYMVPTPAPSPTPPPPISNVIPYLIYYRDANGITTLLYSYDNTAKAYTAVADTTGKATVGYVNSQFQIQFAGAAEPIVVCVSSNDLDYQNGDNYQDTVPYRAGLNGLVIQGGDMFDRTPLSSEVPRLDFYYAQTRICSVTASGFFAPSYDEGTPESGTGNFEASVASNLVATFGPGLTNAEEFVVD